MLKTMDWVAIIECREIHKRQNIISNFLESKQLRINTQNLLRAMGDLERLAGRACAGHASPRDLIAIANGLKKLPKLKSIIKLFKNELRLGQINWRILIMNF